MAGFHDGAIGHREFLAANIALAHTDFAALHVEAADARGLSTGRAHRTIWPKACFDEFQSGGF
jgi:hypothetical protein